MNIAISSWCLHRDFMAGNIDMPEFIRLAKEEFGVSAIETVNWQLCEYDEESAKNAKEGMALFATANGDKEIMQKAGRLVFGGIGKLSMTPPTDLTRVKDALKKYGVTVVNMPIDVGNISQLDEAARKADLAIIKKWVDIAAELGALGARVNTGAQPEGVFDLSITAASYRELAEHAASKGINIVLENHGGMSADPKNIVKLFQMVDHKNFRICPDFGNFAPEIRYEALDMIWDNALLVHAKTYSFDENGDHVEYDFAKCIGIAKKHGFDGTYSVEFEGQGDPYDGVKKTIALLKKTV